jgi:hypothetical protein
VRWQRSEREGDRDDERRRSISCETVDGRKRREEGGRARQQLEDEGQASVEAPSRFVRRPAGANRRGRRAQLGSSSDGVGSSGEEGGTHESTAAVWLRRSDGRCEVEVRCKRRDLRLGRERRGQEPADWRRSFVLLAQEARRSGLERGAQSKRSRARRKVRGWAVALTFPSWAIRHDGRRRKDERTAPGLTQSSTGRAIADKHIEISRATRPPPPSR